MKKFLIPFHDFILIYLINSKLLVVIRLTCPMRVIYARHAYMLLTLHQNKKKTSTNQQRIRIAIQ
jgi:hypothetical protein